MNKKIEFLCNNFVEILLSIPKTIFFNFRVLPVNSAVRLPFFVSHHIKLKGINRKNFIVENAKLRFASQRVGFEGSNCGYRESKKGLISVEGDGKIIIKGDIGLSRGIIIEACDGEIVFGKHFRSNYSSTIYCKESSIIFGDEVVLGWRVTVKNGDGHNIVEKGVVKKMSAPIVIGNHVWICSCCDILKGVVVGDDSVVSYRSLLVKADGEKNVLYGGSPARIIRKDINWSE